MKSSTWPSSLWSPQSFSSTKLKTSFAATASKADGSASLQEVKLDASS